MHDIESRAIYDLVIAFYAAVNRCVFYINGVCDKHCAGRTICRWAHDLPKVDGEAFLKDGRG